MMGIIEELLTYLASKLDGRFALVKDWDGKEKYRLSFKKDCTVLFTAHYVEVFVGAPSYIHVYYDKDKIVMDLGYIYWKTYSDPEGEADYPLEVGTQNRIVIPKDFELHEIEKGTVEIKMPQENKLIFGLQRWPWLGW